jgi:hypothetical protein
MPVLARQPLTVPLGGPLDTDTADKLLPVGRSLELENAVFQQSGRVSKRAGNTALASPTGLPWRLGTRNGALVSVTQTPDVPLEVYAEGGSAGGARWIAPTSKQRSPVSARRTPVYSGAGTQPASPDVAYSSGTNLFVTAFDALVPGANYQMTTVMTDATTGIAVRSNAVGAVAFQADPRVITIGTYVVVVYHDNAGDLFVNVYSLANLEAGTGPTTYNISGTAHHTDPHSDLIAGSAANTLDVAYRSSTNTTRRVTVDVSLGTTVDTEVTTAAAASINPSLGLAWVQDLGSSGKFSLITASAATGIQVQSNLTGGLPASTYTIDASATANVFGITGYTISSVASGEFVVLWNLPTLPANKSDTKFGKRTVAGGIIAPVNFIRGMLLESKVFSYGGDVFVMLGYVSGTQPTYFMVRVSSTHDTTPIRAPLARTMVTEASGLGVASRPYLPSVVSFSSTERVTALQKETRIETAGGSFTVDTGVDLVRLRFLPNQQRPADAGDTLYVPGGSLLAFDGSSYSDYTHPLYPEGFVYTSTSGAAGSLTVGDHEWCWVYRYTDNNGRVIRSQPSIPVARTVVANDKLTFTGLSARMHDRPSGSDVVIEQYMTAAGGSEFRLEKVIANDPTASTFTTTSEMSDTDLEAEEFLYTTGGVLANNPIAGTRATLLFRDRLWFISDDDPSTIWASSVITTGVGFTFSDQVVIEKRDGHGDFVAIAGYGLNTYLFKETAIYAVNGAGPNALGQGDFGETQEVAVGNGVSDPRTIVTTPVGVFWRGPKGIYRMSGGAPEYIGAPVRAFESLTITSAEAYPDLNQVRFYTGVLTLVFDWFRGQWSVFRTFGTMSIAVNWRGRQAVDYNSGEDGDLIVAEDTTGTVFADNGHSYSLKITTPWISVSGLQGVERIYQIEGVGDLADAHTLGVTVRYDNDDGPTQAYSKTFASTDDWEWQLRPQRQVCTAVKITLEGTNTGSSNFEGFSAAAIVLLLGVEPAHLKRLQATVKALASA